MKYLLLFMATICSMVAHAQEDRTFNLSLLSNNQQLINDAVKQGFVIISHSYQLEDTTTHQRFGRYGNSEFGTGTALGVRVSGGVITTENMITPWEYDRNFQKYRDSHNPVTYKLTERTLGDSIAHSFNGDVLLNRRVGNGTLTIIPDSTISYANGFSIDSVSKDCDSWLVWVVSNSIIEKSESYSDESLIIHKLSISESLDSIQPCLKGPNTDKKVWGGILLTPTYPSIGKISFVLSGILTKGNSDVWELNMLSPQNKEDEENTCSDLTPIENTLSSDDGKPEPKVKNKKKKAKKNE